MPFSSVPAAYECFAPFHEGQQIRISNGAAWNTADLVMLALEASLALSGKPVRCAGVLPGASMRVTTGPLQLFDDADKAEFLDDVWRQIRPLIIEWLVEPLGRPHIVIGLTQGDNSRIVLTWDAAGRISPGVAEVHVDYDASFAATYAKRRLRHPLIEHAPDAKAVRRQALITLRRLLVTALNKSRQTVDERYARLPVHVRYRVTGALAAWQALQKERMHQVSDPSIVPDPKRSPITKLVRDSVAFTQLALPNGLPARSSEYLASEAAQSAVWASFEERGGQFYEPSLALHRLLGEAYIADDVPIGALSLPMDTLCIIPESSTRAKEDTPQAIVLFRNGAQLSCAAWSREKILGRVPIYSFNVIEFPLGEPDRTIRNLLLDVHAQQAAADDTLVVSPSRAASSRQFWRQTLDYAIKVLLYLTVRDAHVVPHREYSEAPRKVLDLKGLGKRRRAERLEVIEQLYDRYVVGPAILDEELAHSMPPDTPSREVRSHWRRPHFKMQRCGPKGRLRKLVFIGPSIVRADRLKL
ncbi:hypothetical protein ACIUYH_08705 [Pseudomonas aeruginosa]|nr:hypothetical protein [Pseudomonas aeruginosa]HBP6242156.1 hypothetical protein [Pseudomonas aeruginosa]